MFNMPTSGPLSPTVSLERRKLEQEGIPPGQEQQGSAAKGSPISGNLAQLIQLNRMIQQQGAMQQQANPAPSTVAQDLMQRAMQQRAPQMQPQMNPRQQGIANLPQEAVGNGMAAGGIVAFDDGGFVGGLLDPGYGQGLKDLVPTLSAPKNAPPSELEMALTKARAEATKNPEWYAAERKRMEDAAGLTAIWKKQQEEQDRLKAEASPEAKKKAFWNNLSAQLAGQIGQRGVSTSSRLAQMLGAVGGARSGTEEEFKKRNAELNKAANDLQEKQAMYRMTGTMADRDVVAKAQREYEKAALDKENAERLAKQEAANERFKERQLQVQAAAAARDKTPWESLGPDITRLQKLIQAKQAKGASAQEIAPLQTQLDSLMKTYNTVNPGLYGATTRLQGVTAETSRKINETLSKPTHPYSVLGRRIENIKTNGKDIDNKPLTPEARQQLLQQLEAQRAQIYEQAFASMSGEAPAQGSVIKLD